MRKTGTSGKQCNRHLAGVVLFSIGFSACAGRADMDHAIESLANQVTSELPTDAKPKVAVTDFSGDFSAASYVTDTFMDRLHKSGHLQLVERESLKAVLDEQKLGAGGLVDDETAARIGHLAGADLICVGSLRPLANEVQLQVRVIDSTKALVVASASEFVSSGAVKAVQPVVAAPRAAPVMEVRETQTTNHTSTIVTVTLVVVGAIAVGSIVAAVLYANVPPSGRLGVAQF